ncbi:Sel1-like repeat-containing protein kinase family protein [Chitinimonas koreensis]|uniref:Sel1-like repeat-containing protein kinase family protein n=1 Tax=Chitinimonas koreensis TaxID=356302 RepID=UPI00042377C0|nr:tetratricopeptide repeat protein [Chitinimonas koreensis]QNM95793.1 SEL1-like repeat protein [Chitinimonas koreensis]
MTDSAEAIAPPEPAVQLDKFISQRDTERWCKRLSADYPAADYWLCHEARILQGFQRDPRYAARFVAVDLDRRMLVCEADGHPLTHWLSTRVGELEHPFQRSSDLLRLILASLRALAHLSRDGLVHGGLRPDTLVLKQNDRGEIDYDSLTLVDFAVARTGQERIEKPLFIDLASPDAAYLAPALREAVLRDWRTYAKLVGEPGKSSWYELSDAARRQYASVLMPDLSVNTLDWRVDLHALGHWFRQISLHRIDYFKDSHQEELPALIKKMQKSMLHGGFTSLDACIKAFEAFEMDKRMLAIAEPPQTASVVTMQPSPVLHANSADAALPASPRLDDDFSPRPAYAGQRSTVSSSYNRWVGMGAGLLLALVAGAALLRSREEHASVPATPPVAEPAAATGAAPAPQLETVAQVDSTQPAPPPVQTIPVAPVAESAPPPAADYANQPIEALRSAAEGGDPAAQTQLGLRYRKGQDVPADNQKAVEWYRRAAEQNHAGGQAYLGFMYMTGRGVDRNDDEAARYSRLAADQGDSTGQFNLALLYLAGRGVPKDNVAAYRWLKRAAERDDAARARLAALKRQLNPAQLAAAEAS